MPSISPKRTVWAIVRPDFTDQQISSATLEYGLCDLRIRKISMSRNGATPVPRNNKKLTPAQAAAIAVDPRTSRIVAAEYGVSAQTVCVTKKRSLATPAPPINKTNMTRKNDIDVFFERIRRDANSDCWLYDGPLRGNDRQYGSFFNQPAHRFSFKHFKGDPAGLMVYHTCDNLTCVNPDHLVAGTSADNHRMRIARGVSQQRCGIDHHATKLTEDQVRAIRLDPRIGPEIARDYRISAPLVWYIKQRKSWKHLPD